jgi:hypothetical protein
MSPLRGLGRLAIGNPGAYAARLHDSAAARLRHAIARRSQELRQCGYGQPRR